ncbi:MAG: DUF3159 domain-containing protein [Chloroflexi bacterium]|nr:DUF3159 domain-containing protein [Chloroflexota bacterium]
MKTSRFRELGEEFRTVFAGRGKLADSVIPPVVFVIVNAVLGFDYAVWSALALAVLITVIRLNSKQPLAYALGGMVGVVVAILIAKLLDRAEGYFVPAIITGGLTVVLCGVSVIAGRPLVAWTSYIARRWPLGWYWHPRVRPAYTEVTIAWTVFFAVKLAVQIMFFQEAQAGALAVVNVITGWPATVVLLALSYVYGLWRLGHLQGPSVEEFKAGADPPWTGQRRGF